ncbi:MAG: hypothetical protein KJ941_03415, partial [Bacteroidetes bacterium]|nr:hypothetical protein [Bacteroidota bacterium]
EVFVTLQKATAKHRFSLPPNKLTQIQVMNYLELGMTARFDTFDLFSEEVQRWKAKKKSWFRSLMPF